MILDQVDPTTTGAMNIYLQLDCWHCNQETINTKNKNKLKIKTISPNITHFTIPFTCVSVILIKGLSSSTNFL